MEKLRFVCLLSAGKHNLFTPYSHNMGRFFSVFLRNLKIKLTQPMRANLTPWTLNEGRESIRLASAFPRRRPPAATTTATFHDLKRLWKAAPPSSSTLIGISISSEWRFPLNFVHRIQSNLMVLVLSSLNAALLRPA